eukprot:scaffold33550_cov114-Skeletonema_dohrnii-CCMP3373.AAC.2
MGQKSNHVAVKYVRTKLEGVCIRHGAQIKLWLCSSEGCTNLDLVIDGGVFTRHGAKVKQCNSKGCTNLAKCECGGLCIRHGAKVKRCSSEGCNNHVIKGDEGAKDAQIAGGVWKRHGPTNVKLYIEECTTKSSVIGSDDAVANDVQMERSKL